MPLFYNIIQLFALVFLLPMMVLLTLFSKKYRARIPQRLGIGLRVPGKINGRPRVWVHALSVGEVISAKPLLKALRREIPECELFFSSVTQGGQLVAQEMAVDVDQFIAFPFDFFFTVKRFIARVQPDIFVLVETDFWPNSIWQFKKNNIPSVLVNGRIAQRSFDRYCLVKPIFASFFNSFSALAMQMENGRNQLQQLGVEPHKVASYGNLKFDLDFQMKNAPELSNLTRHFKDKFVFVAGSSHDGEESILLESFAQLVKKHDNLVLVIAPRDINRAQSVFEIAKKIGLSTVLECDLMASTGQVIVLNTVGKLVYLYHYADLSFVGGSLVDERGHNPLEPAYWGKPVLFGPYMDDFFEASHDLIEAEAATQVTPDTLSETIRQLIVNPDLRKKMGRNAAAFVYKHRGAAKSYAKFIKTLLVKHDS
jgi:3-deoxy-D-manno-octulosonic-acid transferase